MSTMNFISSLLIFGLFKLGRSSEVPSFFERESRIIGGKEVSSISSYPHQVSFQSKSNGHVCGGAIIHERAILTARHCFDGVHDYDTKVKAGSTRLGLSIGSQTRDVERLIGHEDFNYENAANDIGIVILKTPFRLNTKVKKIDLYKASKEESGIAKLTGWGSTSFPETDELSNKLMYLESEVMKSDECAQLYKELNLHWAVTDKQMCFGGEGVGFCGGDSGAPLVCEDGSLCGIASWGFECGIHKYPGVFTRVKGYVPWIEKHIKDL
uniref:Trypsin n=1 Tax=Caligus rogercresseyi TaxID=217165 RepID=C1BPB9_CALRO|nr:Trypsin precursor [Caligus rogercresseyi]|eukprot:TRINITY_DN6087_c0_g1_i1.p1 TRINITY_DN6087_c0_g1~~TRINITY_DN6087_c0_g1_i1.p1  ORF type:complete len:268 (-),score=20.96 TRINITY_DN6087_c0_g1_i1:12-815(-)